jgi:predicted transcriptional regulator
MTGEQRERTERAVAGASDTAFDELLRTSLEVRSLVDRSDAAEGRLDTDRLIDVVRHGPVLEALLREPLDRRGIERRLDVSRATSHRFTRWLDERGLAEKRDGRFRLTGYGEVVTEELLRFERNVAAAERLGPLLEHVCEDHKEFVVEPFADATVTVATPEDPYRPVRRFASLVDASESLRGFNTVPMASVSLEEFHREVLEDTDVELIYPPAAVERLRSRDPEGTSAAEHRGELRLRTRAALPYGLVILDDHVGIGGYDEETGAMRVFVDTDAAVAREWAERVYAVYRDRSTPLPEGAA